MISGNAHINRLHVKTACKHCRREFKCIDDSAFCCRGCEAVYSYIAGSGLEHFYQLQNSFGFSKPLDNRGGIKDDYSYLDLADLKKEYLAPLESGDFEFRLFIEGIHCLGCLWILEKLPQLVPGILSSRLNASAGVLTLVVTQKASLAAVASTITKLGYIAHPLALGSDTAKFKLARSRSELKRIAVLGAGAGNIMLLAAGRYLGASGNYGVFFDWLQAAIFVPVFFLGCVPLLKATVGGIRLKQMSVDIPLAIGIVLGTVMSYYALLTHFQTNQLYFDSMAAFLFLLHASRYFVQSIQVRANEKTELSQNLLPRGAWKVHPHTQSVSLVSSDRLVSGDEIEIRTSERTPTHVKVTECSPHGIPFDLSVVNGESEPKFFYHGEQVPAGALNLGPLFRACVLCPPRETELAKTLATIQTQFTSDSHTSRLTDRASKTFLLAILILGSITFFTHGFSTALALIIIVCPCGLALSSPLVGALTLARASSEGILIKSANVIEQLEETKTLIMDKTGTLTFGQLRVSKESWYLTGYLTGLEQKRFFKDALYLLESKSSHPVGKAIAAHLASSGSEIKSVRLLTEIHEEPGIGIRGRLEFSDDFQNRKGWLEVKKSTAPESQDHVFVFWNDSKIASFELSDIIRPEANHILNHFRDQNVDVLIATGDRKSIAESVGRELGFDAKHILADLGPTQKQEQVIKSGPGTVFMGDGANDALALRAATVGIAISGGVPLSLEAASVYLTQSGLEPLQRLFEITAYARTILRQNMILAVTYNIFGVALILGVFGPGFAKPLLAAILMPIAAISVFVSSQRMGRV